MAEPRLRADPRDRTPVSSGGGQNRPPRRTRRRAVGRLEVAALVVLWTLIIGASFLGYFALTLPDTTKLDDAQRRPSITILAADGEPIATYGDLFGRPLTLAQMSPYLPEAVIATEDRSFYSNIGIDPVAIARAALADLLAGRIVEGGSTITQQLAKNLFLNPRRDFGRKIREALLALWLAHHFTKNEVLELYLNRTYFGAGAYGVDAAAHRYFHKSASDLTLYQSAMIAGLLQAPTRLNPIDNPQAAEQRTAQVLDNMVDAGYITAHQADLAKRRGTRLRTFLARRPGSRYFADWVADQVPQFIGGDRSDITVVTTLDPRMQSAADRAVDGVIDRYGKRFAVSEGALVAMSPDGAVRAMVGGRNYASSQFNRATEAERQPGSAFKPFVYLAGLESGLDPSERFLDQPIRIGNWQPHDYTRHYLGEVTMAEALAQSINTVAVEIAERAGLRRVVAVAHQLGISSPLPRDPSIALGAGAVNLLELVSAYAPFANGGYGILPYAVTEIHDRTGRILYRRSGSGLGRVIDPALVGEMNEMLSGVIADGTGRRAALPRPAAGKTGTTQDYRDAWFVGYTANLVAGVWMGNDNDRPMRGVVGGSLPAETWRSFMLAATRGMQARPLPGTPAAAMIATAPTGTSGGSFLDNLFRIFGSGRAGQSAEADAEGRDPGP